MVTDYVKDHTELREIDLRRIEEVILAARDNVGFRECRRCGQAYRTDRPCDRCRKRKK